MKSPNIPVLPVYNTECIMKSTFMFRDQVGVLSNWFQTWNSCEKTVAVYSLLRKLPPAQAKFLQQVLNNTFLISEKNDLNQTEQEANDPACINQLVNVSKGDAVNTLLKYLPLLRVGNSTAKAEYVKALPRILHHSIEFGCHVEESRQLLSYWLIHPALTAAERGQFSFWLSQLEERCPSANHAGGSASGEADSNDNKANWNDVVHMKDDYEVVGSAAAGPQRNPSDGKDSQIPSNAFTNGCDSSRSGSLNLSASRSVSNWLSQQDENYSHAPLSPQSSESSSGSGSEQQDETHTGRIGPFSNERNTFIEEHSGMRDVPVWLKSLRLHKYSYLFQTMSYEEMMGLTEEWLESQHVTKGARNKIILSIKKLKNRPAELQAMEKEIMDSGNLKTSLQELKSMLNTPLKRSVQNDEANESETDSSLENDLPGQITRVLGKFCTQLLIGMGRADDDCYALYLQLLDRCSCHEAFVTDQRNKFLSWKQQIQKIWHPSKYGLDRHRKLFQQQQQHQQSVPFPVQWLRQQRPPRAPQILQKQGQPKWTFNGRPPVPSAAAAAVMAANFNNIAAGGAAAMGLGSQQAALSGNALYRNNSFNTAFTHRGLIEMKQPVTRTHSAPMRTSQYPISLASRPMADQQTPCEEPSETDLLCSSMAKHALGSFGESL